MEKTRKYEMFVNAKSLYFSTENEMIDLGKFLLDKGFTITFGPSDSKTE